MSIYYVYLYRDEIGTPIYVGKGSKRRAWYHLHRRDKHEMTHKIQKMLREGHNPQPEFLCKDVDEEFALFAEEEAIRKYGRKDLGTGTLLNLSDGGESGSSGAVWCEEARVRLSESNKGKKHTEESKQKMSERLKGKPKSQEHKDKLRSANLGKTLSDETRAKMSKAHKGKKLSNETRARISAAKRKDNE